MVTKYVHISIVSTWNRQQKQVANLRELESHTDTDIVCDGCLVSWQWCVAMMYIIMLIQTIHIKGFTNHLVCLIQCPLNGNVVNEVPMFLADNPSETTHAVQVVYLYNGTKSLIIPLK